MRSASLDRAKLTATESSICISGISVACSDVSRDELQIEWYVLLLKNEDTWCKVLVDFRSQIRFSSERIRRNKLALDGWCNG